MLKKLLILLALPLLLAADGPKDDAVKTELKKWEGGWKVTLAERDGEKLPADKVKLLRVIVVGDKVTIKDSRGDDTATIRLDPAKKPATMDLLPADDDKPALGIYEWTGDSLKLCWGKAGGPRPKEFATKPDVETVLFILEREK